MKINLELFKFFNKIGNFFYRKHVLGIKSKHSLTK